MGEPFLGEIRLFAGSFAPVGWALCDGTPIPISENEALYQVLGTAYGGDGQETFNLPDLRGRVPVHQGTGSVGTSYQLGETGGVENVALSTQQIPVHSHVPLATTSTGVTANPAGNVLAASPSSRVYVEDQPTHALAASVLGPVGGSQPHTNMMPTLAINYIISLFGMFPSPT